jgi:hypothetical protein
MSRIDDPLDAVKKHYPAPSALVDVLINVGAELHPFAGMINAVRHFCSKGAAEARVEALLQALEWYVREHERRIEDLSEKTGAPEFIETLLIAADKALHTANVEKLKRFACVLGHELLSEGDARSYEDDAAYIRTLSELGEADIAVLSVIYAFQVYLLSDEGRSHESDAGRLFWGLMRGVYGEIAERGIPFDEFYSKCSRLNSYGLVHRVSSGPGWWGSSSNDPPYEIEGGAYFITYSGKRLIDILGNSLELLAKADVYRQQVLSDIEQFKSAAQKQS